MKSTAPAVLTWAMWIRVSAESARAISRAVMASSLARSMPGTPSSAETVPLCMMPPFISSKSSQWEMVSRPFCSAETIPSRMSRAEGTGFPSSDTATAPAAFRAAMSVRVSPCIPLVMAATGYTWALADAAFSKIYWSTSGESATGLVLGMQATAVTPPAAAASHPVRMSSLWVKPGSRR